jgi:hypothetical protein
MKSQHASGVGVGVHTNIVARPYYLHLLIEACDRHHLRYAMHACMLNNRIIYFLVGHLFSIVIPKLSSVGFFGGFIDNGQKGGDALKRSDRSQSVYLHPDIIGGSLAHVGLDQSRAAVSYLDLAVVNGTGI